MSFSLGNKKEQAKSVRVHLAPAEIAKTYELVGQYL